MFAFRLLFTITCSCALANLQLSEGISKPVVIATWNFVNATLAAWDVIDRQSGTAVDSIVAGGTSCEEEPCGSSVGFGGSPDEHGETTLDAMIMDGLTFEAGAVANLRNVKNAIGVAHAVMKHTKHTLLVGSLATEFAVMMGFKLTNLSTSQSVKQWESWKKSHCQPNFWQNVSPNPKASCGPYKPSSSRLLFKNVELEHDQTLSRMKRLVNDEAASHDTIGLLAIDKFGNIAGGTTTNGATFKIPGRVGDSPIVGSGAYADNSVGGAAATGDGDLMMRFLPSFYAVELMRNGKSPTEAAVAAINRIAKVFPSSSAALIAINMAGNYGAACHGFSWFSFTLMSPDFHDVQIVDVPCS